MYCANVCNSAVYKVEGLYGSISVSPSLPAAVDHVVPLLHLQVNAPAATNVTLVSAREVLLSTKLLVVTILYYIDTIQRR
jgi:hypothetical protein